MRIAKVISACRSTNQGHFAQILGGANIAFGNSSSLIREAPFIGTKSVVIGDRQRGRKRPKSVKHCSLEKNTIERHLKERLAATFEDQERYWYGDGETSKKAVDFILKNYDIEIQK